MLRRLYIKNYALIEEITVDLDRGLSIITGETGAGKSILMDAISLLIGERASADLIRRGENKAVVEAEFDISQFPEIKNVLLSNDIDCETTELIIRRELNQKSTARAFINDSPASISLLKELGAELLDLHGQHEHQSLLHQERHIDFLDEYAALISQRKKFADAFEVLTNRKKEYEELLRTKDAAEKERDFYEFQLNEIRSIDPKAGEDEEIERELSILEHSEELRNVTGELYDLLYESEDSVYLRLAKAKSSLERLKTIDSNFNEQFLELQSAIAVIDDLSHSISHYGDKVELQPERLELLRNRQLALSRLKKKYGPTLGEVIATYQKLQDQLGPEQNINEKLTALEKELRTLQAAAAADALALSESRKKAAKQFEKKIVNELKELGIENGQFRIDFQSQELAKKGSDKVEFFISTNKGESPKPLIKVASGGEVSRIMLALKTILSASGSIPLMIFDEIDSGISGRIAQQVGKAMKALSQKHQIIAITHLGQIAAFADTHFVVEKSSKGETTSSSLRKLSKKEHEEEIARLISGTGVTDHSLKAARSLVQEANSLVAA
jgi:DNA repair protein RecN (Recombination protein N)